MKSFSVETHYSKFASIPNSASTGEDIIAKDMPANMTTMTTPPTDIPISASMDGSIIPSEIIVISKVQTRKRMPTYNKNFK